MDFLLGIQGVIFEVVEGVKKGGGIHYIYIYIRARVRAKVVV